MKKQISIASAFVAASGLSLGEIKVNEYLSFEGFVDASYSVAETDYGAFNESDNAFGVQEVEIDWLFNYGQVGARVDLQYEDRFLGSEEVEQAFVTYELCTGSLVTAGRYGTMLGYESLERPGLHQGSFAYDLHLAATGIDGAPHTITTVGIVPRYNQGVKYTYENDAYFFGASLQDSVFNFENGRFGGDAEGFAVGSYGLELAGSMKLSEGLRWFLGGAYEKTDIEDFDKNYMLNTYLAYEAGPLSFGLELNYGKSESGLFALDTLAQAAGFVAAGGLEEKVLQGMIVANYAYSDNASITGRISYSDHSDDVADEDVDADAIKYTIAHKYAYTDNLALVNELSYVDGSISDGNDNADLDSTILSASLLFTF